MASEWVRLCQRKDFIVDGPHVAVQFRDGRRHRIKVEQQDDAFLLSAFVVKQAVASALPDLPVDIWLRNRAVSLVGFRIDRQGRLLGESWVPKAGLTADEFQLYLHTIAVECDRLEYLLTGRDVE